MATRSRRLRVLRLPLLLTVLGVLAYVQSHLNRERSPKGWMTTPVDQGALHSMQERIQSATSRVMPTVVAIKDAVAATPRPYASGVIITADGLILSQFHVSHRLAWKPGDPVRSRQPGERTMVVLSDGRRIEAELLGADSTFDLSLLRLLEPGPYPHARLDPSSKVQIGDWVLKLGHPLYRRDRPPVVRLGRVLFQNKDIFVTDCLITGGDSGGPFFDLEGRLVGIVHSNSVPAKLRDSLSSLSPESTRIGPFSSTTNRFIQQRLDGMLRREIAPFDQKAAERFQESYRRVDDDDEILPRDQWTQGAVIARAFPDVIRNSRRSVVTILDEAGHDVAQGTIVESGGWIVTMASALPADPRCRQSDGQVVAAQVVGVEPAFDLALLRVQVTDLPAVPWAQMPPPVAGTIVAALGMSEIPHSIGIVSVPQRNLPGPFPTRISHRDATRPEVSGKPTAGGYLVNSAWGESLAAGIHPGDVILTIAGREVRNNQDLLDVSRGHGEGERVPVLLLRGDQRLDLILRLVAELKPFAGFPTLFEHDMPLARGDCGGPVVNLAGEVVGITLHRGQYGCMAIPGGCVKQLLPVLKSSGVSGKWIKPRTAKLEKR